jgi:hypothetical protein
LQHLAAEGVEGRVGPSERILFDLGHHGYGWGDAQEFLAV